MRREIRELLAHDTGAAESRGTEVGTALGRAAADALGDDLRDRWVGRTLGSYRVEREIGRGGMGVVLLAERADGAFEKKVAIKLSLTGLVSAGLAERLEHERRILASLDHPAIARLLDGGTTEEGLPYVVMEYVEGVPVDEYCRTHELTLRERIELVLRVCDAVEHAHRKLVVHRDLKPSNVLVTDDGQPKLLDFGIATLLDPSPDPGAARVPRTIVRALTPVYASPEQLRGDQVTTASDVYALGVVLFELLTGKRPFALDNASPADAERIVTSTDPPKPSTRSLEPFSRALRGDLDNIVLEALRREPERRYASVRELADDLRRHLEGLPVRARPNTLVYRAGRFVGRHRLGVAATVAAALALAAGLAYHTHELTRERDRALRAAEKSERIAEYLKEIFRTSTPNVAQGKQVTAVELLERGAASIDAELGSEPELGAELAVVMAEAFRSLASYDRADELLADAADRVSRAEGQQGPRYAQVLLAMASLRAAQGREEEAAELTTRAREILESATGEDAAVATVLHNLAILQLRAAKYDDALELARQAFDRRVELHGEDHPRSLSSLSIVARAHRKRGANDEALALFGRLLDKQLEVLGENHSATAETLTDLAQLEELLGDLAGATRRMERALGIRQRIFPPEHPSVAITMINLAGFLDEAGDRRRAEELARESLRIFRKTLPAEHENISLARAGLARIYASQGRFDDALDLQREAVEELRQRHGDRHPRYVVALHNFAAMEFESGAFTAALATYRRLVPLWVSVVGPNHQNVAFARAGLAKVLIELDQPEAAREQLLMARDIALESLGPENPVVASYLHHLGRAARVAGRLDEARELLEAGLAMRERVTDGPSNLYLADSHYALGELALAEGRPALARESFEKSLAMREAIHDGPHYEIALARKGLARARALVLEASAD